MIGAVTSTNTLISIVGPTGSGKSDLAVRLAVELGRLIDGGCDKVMLRDGDDATCCGHDKTTGATSIPIISTDSRQVYRGMAIGTAQPTDDQLDIAQHYFIADREPTERFTCADFEREAMELLEELFAQSPHDADPNSCEAPKNEALKATRAGRVAIAVGGSGLYVDALCRGLDEVPDVDPEIRKSLTERLSQGGLKPLLDLLAQLDPVYYEQVDRQNPARVQRALEVCLQTGRPFSSFRRGSSLATRHGTGSDVVAERCVGHDLNTGLGAGPDVVAGPSVGHDLAACQEIDTQLHTGPNPTQATGAKAQSQRPFRVLTIVLDPPREELYRRIDARVDAMMKAGLEAEARALYPLRQLPALQTVGYRELNQYFNYLDEHNLTHNETELTRAIELIKRNSRRYAKRQTTWFRRKTEAAQPSRSPETAPESIETSQTASKQTGTPQTERAAQSKAGGQTLGIEPNQLKVGGQTTKIEPKVHIEPRAQLAETLYIMAFGDDSAALSTTLDWLAEKGVVDG